MTHNSPHTLACHNLRLPVRNCVVEKMRLMKPVSRLVFLVFPVLGGKEGADRWLPPPTREAVGWI